MTSSTAVDVHPVVAAYRAAADALTALPLWQLSAADEASVLAELEIEQRRMAFGWLGVLADFDARAVAADQAAISTQAFLVQRLRLSPSEAKSRIRAAGELAESTSPSGDRIPPVLAKTAAAAAAGEISMEHVRVISKAIEKLPADPAIRFEAEESLARHAVELDPAALSIVGRRIHTMVDPDGTLDDDKPARRELAFVRDVGDCDIVRGRLDAEGAAIVRTAVEAISAPEPQDRRSPARRRADGLIELCRRYLDSGELPRRGGEKPHITVTMRLDDLSATLNAGQPISAEAARRLACDANIIPAVLGGNGQPLDIGRASRTIPPAIRRAVTVRDRGCIHSGCGRPADWCDVHHVRHWMDGGGTAVDNLCLLCHEHHWTIHHSGWEIAFVDGIPHVIPPAIVDPERRPRRNTLHDTG
jgi:hypothetical protein